MNEFRRILVTGATGFVGPHVLQALSPGVHVRALVRDPGRAARMNRADVEVVAGALDDPDALSRAVDGVDAVLHLAAATRAGSEQEYAAVNVEGTRRLVEAARAAAQPPRRLVYLSSMAAAGPSLDDCPVRPGDTPRPLTAYGRTKLAGEEVCRAAADTLEVVILRAPAVYGPGDRDLYHFFRLAARGILTVPTGAARPLQFVHVEDLARAIGRALEPNVPAGVYQIAEARAYAWEDVARMVGDAVGRRTRVLRVHPALIHAAAWGSEWGGRMTGGVGIFNRDKARELLAPGWLCDTESARSGLNFETRIPLAEGLAATAAWYRANGWL